MGYRIQYAGRFAEEMIKTVETKDVKRNHAMTWLYLFTACTVLLAVYLHHGTVLPAFLPGAPDVTAAAIEIFIDCISGGGGFAEASAAFCRKILEAAL